MKIYRLWDADIYELEAERETKCFYIVNKARMAKVTEFDSLHKTVDGAIDAYIEQQEKLIKKHEKYIQEAKTKIKKFTDKYQAGLT